MFLPVSKELYWYFTAYTALFFIMPLLNAAVRGCTGKQLKQMLIGFMAKGAFAGYLLNNQRFVWKYVMDKNFVFLVKEPAWVLITAVLGFAVLFVTAAVLIDHVRLLLFRIFGINKVVQKVSDGIDSYMEKIKE